MNNHLILYSFRRCPYAMRARIALALSGLTYILREIDLKNKAPIFLDTSPKGTVPVLQLPSGDIIDESLLIVEWAIEHALTPTLKPSQLTSHLTLQHLHTHYIPALNRFKYPDRTPGGTQPTDIQTLTTSLIEWNQALTQHPFLESDAPSALDCALFPMIRQTRIADPQWFETLSLPSLKCWLQHWDTLLERSNIMNKYPVWTPKQPDQIIEPKLS
ncbi:MAG: glutathione S-transferase [Legionellales bacterium]|mgnify:CR=1 FL=1|nr:glutathione S-transferase [Legionellales bacterium]|tara:strand:- start:339 stop:986 length:648 start_codon:yes stop_codon:yes gene_type:complete